MIEYYFENYSFDKNIINYLRNCNQYINNLTLINDYWNDDEDDEHYEHYTKKFKEMNNELRIEHRKKEVDNLMKKYDSYRKKNKKIVDKIYKNNKENIVNMHVFSLFKSTPDGLIYKCNFCKQICFVK